LSPPESAGASKFGPWMKRRAPVAASIVKRDESAPPVIE
jgi:hypothetical protein